MRYTTLLLLALIGQPISPVFAQLNPSPGQNAIVTQSPRTALSVVSATTHHADAPATVQYLDGLGRPFQILQVKGAGDASTDILTEQITYDAFGRPQTGLLVAPSANVEGTFFTTTPASASYSSNRPALTPLSSATAFYGDTRPFAETIYEASPLARPLQQWGAGQNWFANNRNTTTRYSTAAGVIRFKASQIAIFSKINNQTPVEYFRSVDIARTIITDEQSNTTIAYTDLQGRTVRRDVVLASGDTLTTAYAYDNFERLSAVIPPKLYNWFKAGNTELFYRLGSTPNEWLNGLDNPLFKESAYVYLYDLRSRLTAKHVPNAGWTDLIYDRQDRPVMSRDQQDKADGQWRFMQYDGLDRVVLTGRMGLPLSTNYTPDDLRGAFARQTTTNEERSTGAGNLLGYSQVSFPNNATVSFPISASNVLTVNYYDDYAQSSLTYQTMPAPFAVPYSTGGGNTARGLLTGTRTRVLVNTGTVGNTAPTIGNLLETAFFYDDKGRVLQQRGQNHLGGTDQMDTQYSFNGEVLQTRLAHQPATGAALSIITTTYTYDHLGRRTQILHAIGNVAPTVLATYQYDAIGRLMGRQLGGGTASVSQQNGNWTLVSTWVAGVIPVPNGTAQLAPGHTVTVPANTSVGTNRLFIGAGAKLVFSSPNARLRFGTGNTSFLQRQTFHYHLRGWLRGMNLDANNQPTVTNGQHFAFRLNYDENNRFDGNISRQTWAYGRDTQPFSRTFAYTYDASSRLTDATFTGNINEGFSTSNLSYDPNGNLLTMNRTQRFSINGSRSWDILNYGYATLGNSLTAVTDTAPVQPDLGDFREQNTTGADYAYNPDGTLLFDKNRGINPIRYNLLKLPRELSLAGGSRIVSYTYAASGQKLRMRDEQAPAVGGQLNAQRDYVGPFQYLNGALFEIATDEGRWTPAGGYEYFLKDHLGNVRVAFNATGVTQYSDYDPWGLPLPGLVGGSSTNRSRFNGKEAISEQGAAQYDFEARGLDSWIGRMKSVDPMGEQREWLTPYNFVQNNPLRRVDPTGQLDWVVDGDGNLRWDEKANSQETTKPGETYLGKTLTFTFNSYISNTFDGPNPPWGAAGDKLTSTITVKGNESADGSLNSVDVKSSYIMGKTGGLSMFEGRNYFPSLGEGQNKSVDVKGMKSGSVTFEQHASVPGLEAIGLNMLGYDVVNVAQKMTVGVSGNKLSVSAATDVFPSATLSVNGNQLFQYNQPSFKGTHGREVRTVTGDNGMGGSVTTESISRRPAPGFYQRYPK